MSQDLTAGTRTKGSPEKGFWIEPLYFITLTFDKDISTSAFGNAKSVLAKSLQAIGTKAVVIGVGELYDGVATNDKVDIIVGTSQGHYVADPGTSLVIEGFDGLTIDGEDDAGAAFSADVTATFAEFKGLAASAASDLLKDGEDGHFRPATARHFK